MYNIKSIIVLVVLTSFLTGCDASLVVGGGQFTALHRNGGVEIFDDQDDIIVSDVELYRLMEGDLYVIGQLVENNSSPKEYMIFKGDGGIITYGSLEDVPENEKRYFDFSELPEDCNYKHGCYVI